MSEARTGWWRLAVELGARWYVFLFLNVYGWGKMLGGQFYRPGRLPAEVAQTTLGAAAPFDLAWTFMGYSLGYILFIGIAEVVGAWLLLWERTKLLGVAVLMPIMINILVFDWFFLDKYGALASATIYTLLLGLILVLNGERVMASLRALMPDGASPWTVKVVLAALGLMAALFGVDQLLVNWFGHGRG